MGLRDASGDEGAVGFVDLVLFDGVGEALVGYGEEERVEPGPGEDLWCAGKDAEEVGVWACGHGGAGEGSEEAESGL